MQMPFLKRPKVFHVTTVDMTLFAFRELLKYLQSHGFDVSGICSPGSLVSKVQQDGIRVCTTPMTRRITPIQDLISFFLLVKILRREQPLIVHTHTPKANLLGQWAAWLARLPVRISTVHGLYFTPSTPQPKRWLFEWMERVSAWPAILIFVINREDLQTIETEHIASPAKVRLLDSGVGVDLTYFDPERLDSGVRVHVRQELGWDAGHCVVGFVGRLVREKGLLDLFQAVALLKQHVPQMRLLVVGSIDLDKPDCVDQRIAEKYNIADICYFTGRRSDVDRLYLAMDIFVLPSYREGLSIAIMEAQAMGLPVITTSPRGCGESIIHGTTGLVIPPANVEALSHAILDLALDTDLRCRMGVSGRLFAKERFDQQNSFRFHELEYRRLFRELVLPILSTGETLED